MSKNYLEAWNFIKEQMPNFTFSHLVTEMAKNTDIVDNALKRLDSIDNATPSEALECVEDLIFNFSVDEYVDRYDNNLQVIKQALLKQQEPKQYLKWEDLEFKKETQEMHILLNGNLYFISFGLLFGKTQQVELYSKNEEHLMNFNSYYKEDIQFFNDLHLERVEE